MTADDQDIETRLARLQEIAITRGFRMPPRPSPNPKARARHNAPTEYHGQTHVHRGCPIEREFDDAQAKSFAGSHEHDKEALLDSAGQVAAMEHLLRHAHGWIENTDIARQLGITHVNNVASKLRDALDERNTGEDVDARALTPTRWAYRICLKSESFRLKSHNPSRRPGG